MNPSNQFLHIKGLRRIFAPTGGVPETPKHPPRNPAGASPDPGGSANWQRCSFFINKEPQSDRKIRPFAARLSHSVRQLAQSGFQNQIRPGRHRDAVPDFIFRRMSDFCEGENAEGGGQVGSCDVRLPLRNLDYCRVAKRKGNGLISRPRAGSTPAPATRFHAAVDR